MDSGHARPPVGAGRCLRHADARAGRVSAPDQSASERSCTPSGSAVPACGFPRALRLLTARDYATVFASNVRVSDRYWTMLASTGQGASARLGLAIAKKRARRAVDRNRCKRLVRESFRHRHANLGVVDIVVMNRDACAGASNRALQLSLDSLWDQLAIKCKNLS